MSLKKKVSLILGVVALSFFCFSSVIAAEFQVAKEGGSVVISERVSNLYTAGNIISINADVRKSLHAAGNVITITGDVEGNIYVAGATVVIKGDVGGTVHVGAGNVMIEGKIKDDLFVAAGTVVLAKSASVGGDLIMGAGIAEISGPVAGNIHLGGGQIFINSKISGNVNLKADEELKLGSQAIIVGDLEYSSSKEAVIVEGAKVLGETTYKKTKVMAGGSFKVSSILVLGILLKLLTVIVIGLALVYLLKEVTRKVVKGSLDNFWASLGRGFGALILIPVVCVILAFTVIGLMLAGLLGVVYLLMIILASALSSIVFGSWLIKVLGKKSEYSIDWKTVVVGAITLCLISLIPLVGWLIKLVFMLISLGAVFQLIHKNVVSVR